ncbi:MAG TPA: NAD-dependent epimerase/dehydratase family protein [Chromatiales bacterium]|nr:NAD-dependent epimerase/dehydratase family protein [Chromatiales bacterium]
MGEMVLVTGARGFIGRDLLRRLPKSGVRVRALLRESAEGAWDEAVICRLGAEAVADRVVEGVATVFHLAGIAHTWGPAREMSALYRTVNVKGTAALVEAAARVGVRRFVFFSSVKAVRDPGEECIDESVTDWPADPYGRSKREAEEIVLEAGARSGMRVCVLRPTLVYGAGVKGNLLRMMEMIDHRRFPPPPRVDNRRSMVYVGDLVEAALLAARETRANGRTYIVGDTVPVSTREVYQWMCGALGRSAPRWGVPVRMLRAAAAVGEGIGRVAGRPMPLNREVLGRLLGSACYRSDRIRRELGWRPARTLRDALPEMVASYRGRA